MRHKILNSYSPLFYSGNTPFLDLKSLHLSEASNLSSLAFKDLLWGVKNI